MLNRVDRIQTSSHNADATARRWCELLDCIVLGEDRVEALSAKRVTIQVGDSLVEFLEPLGAGIVQAHLDRGCGGPLSIGVTTARFDELAGHLAGLGINGISFGDQLLLQSSDLGIPGLAVLVSPHEDREPVGLMKNLYEATHLTGDAPRSAAEIARIFALDADAFFPHSSDQYGYHGTRAVVD